MLTGVHVLLTYTCIYRCEHCFLYCGPDSAGVFTLAGLEDLLDQAADLGTVREVCFEGGEPFLHYPLLLRGVALARDRGFSVDALTNAYWAAHLEDTGLWLAPLQEAGLSSLGVSDDAFHYDQERPTPARAALDGAARLGLDAYELRIEEPSVEPSVVEDPKGKGEPIVGGGVRFRGRAADELVKGLPRRDWREFTECPDEDLENPERVHVDPWGNVQLCQGLCMGNVRRHSLAEIMASYGGPEHPVCGPLMRGGPAGLVEEYGLDCQGGYVDACHLCFRARQELRERFPDALCPGQAYGE